MDLTKYVLELAIAGIGTITWIVLIFLTIVDVNWAAIDPILAKTSALELVSAIVLILGPFVYVIGIVNDRLVDNLFDALFIKELVQDKFDSKDDYRRALALVCLKSDRLMSQLSYGRMRIRICRAWAVNSVLILVALNIFLWSRVSKMEPVSLFGNISDKVPELSIFFSFLFLVSTYISFLSWKTLTIKEACNLKVQWQLFEEISSKNG